MFLSKTYLTSFCCCCWSLKRLHLSWIAKVRGCPFLLLRTATRCQVDWEWSILKVAINILRCGKARIEDGDQEDQLNQLANTASLLSSIFSSSLKSLANWRRRRRRRRPVGRDLASGKASDGCSVLVQRVSHHFSLPEQNNPDLMLYLWQHVCFSIKNEFLEDTWKLREESFAKLLSYCALYHSGLTWRLFLEHNLYNGTIRSTCKAPPTCSFTMSLVISYPNDCPI